MGRNKPGKPRRPRNTSGVPRQYTLEELQPPGEPYDEWFTIRPGVDPAQITDPRLEADARDLMHRLARLGPLYDGKVPKAALFLDDLIDTGSLPIMGNDKTGSLMPIEMMAESLGSASSDDVRESIHNLHAFGALLVMTDDEHDVAYVRMVAKRPDRPGGRWHFEGEPGLATSKVCIPDEIWQELPIEVAGAVGYMRAVKAKLGVPDPEVYGTHNGVNGTEHAQELFEAAQVSGYVDLKGCEACPTGHLCTRDN